MAISKIIYKTDSSDSGTVWMDTTDKTVAADKMVSGITALKNDGTTVTGNLTSRSSSDLTASGATVTVPAGVYSSQASKAVSSGSATAPASISGTSATVSTGTNTLTLSKTVSVTPSVTAGYVSSGTAGNSAVSLTASVNTRSSSDLTASTLTVTAPAGYYGSDATKTLSDQNLLAENIKKDISIFGVTGSYEGGGGGTAWDTQFDGTVNVTIQEANYYYGSSSGWYVDILENSVWRVTWNGTPYVCTATFTDPDIDNYALGDPGIVGGTPSGNNEPFYIARMWGSVLVVFSAQSGTYSIKLEKQVSGGGSSYTLLYSDEVTVNTTSTTSTAVTTLSTGITFEFGETYLVSIRDEAGERNDYFYGSDSYFYVKSNSFANSTVLYGTCYWLDSSGNIDFSNTLRGVFLYRYYGGNQMGQIQINSRYDSTRGTVNGTFTINVYKVTTPEPVT